MERLWWSRLRWRMRGAWQWPAFFALTVLDALALHARPIVGDHTGVVAAALLAGFFNLLVVAVLAPVAGRLARRWRPGWPKAVASDYAGTVLLTGLCGALLAIGLVHQGAIRADRRAFAAQSRAVRDYVLRQAPPFRSGLALADTRRIEHDLWRTCVPGADPKRPLCLFVGTNQSPPGVTVDHDRAPNAGYYGPS